MSKNIEVPTFDKDKTPDEKLGGTGEEGSERLLQIAAQYRDAEARSLSAQADHQKTHVKLNKQRVKLRNRSVGLAQGVICGLAFFLFSMFFVVVIGVGKDIPSEAQVVIFGAPIVAISAITIFVLKGVFTGFSANEETNGSVVDIATSAAKGTITD